MQEPDCGKNIALPSQPFDSAAQRLTRRCPVESVGIEMFCGRFGLEIGEEGLAQDLLRGCQIFFQQHRGQRQHVADVVKAVTGIVGGKIIRRLEVDAHQVANGIVVFGAVQPANGDAAGVGMVAVAFEDFGLNPGGDQLAFLGCRLRFFLRRHLVRLEVLDHLGEGFAVAQHRRLVSVNAQIEVALFLFAVAAEAIFAKHRFDPGLKRGVASELSALAFPGGVGARGRLGGKSQYQQTDQGG